MSFPLPANETKRLEALRRYRLLDTAPEQAFDDFALLASTLCGVPIALMTLVDEERQWFKARVGLDVAETPRELAFCAHTILGDEMLIVEDATADERFAHNPLVTAAPHIRFYAGAPLIDREGNALGSLCVVDQKAHTLTAAQITAMRVLARRIIAQIELRQASADLAEALADTKTLRGLLPICSHCKSIRDDEGYWQKVEEYIRDHSEADFSHGICPACLRQHFPETYERFPGPPA